MKKNEQLKPQMHFHIKSILFSAILGLLTLSCTAQQSGLSTIAQNGWSNNSVNTVIFRKNALVTFKNVQYAAFYDSDEYLVLAKRKASDSKWETLKSNYKGDAADAHKSISIMVDGKGILHVAWSQHNNNLNYAHSTISGGLILSEKKSMLAERENKVSYPEFYKLANGDLLFLYRDGGSGNGNLVINRYALNTQRWSRIQNNLIDGEGKRNAYWQVAIDLAGVIHISWVWRESPDVASNHDLCYAKSTDGGLTWQKSSGQNYTLPINAGNAEYALNIPQKSELINQTSMFADASGRVFIAGYWREENEKIPQYHLVYKTDSSWRVNNLHFRKTAFSLIGGGTKRIPIARPQIIVWKAAGFYAAGLVFRDEERGGKASIALNTNIESNDWRIEDLTEKSVGDWEPSYDTELWKNRKVLSLFLQEVKQIDGEGKANQPPTAVQVLNWKPNKSVK
ncbi:BNR repeat-containing protein [Pedobacter sp. CFBP9032]|uniref:BNR repeat-containing protein n=1 Tax=Pedobacter sp. CFBP9032 TaxID=3096539 RepID=UPI002A6A929A|nr:BNR repeat-containing protein [Pedobacter sp. CFBP9032]MDY0903286.1 BNR repeat-containing protein [Pedobacter sp. CFBP9032]